MIRILLCGVLGMGCSISGQAPSRPNVLFIFSDDHASHAISAYGSKINSTPHIDRIAREGMLFDNCFVTNSICGPSRAVILTGKHSHKNGFMRNGNRFDGSQQTFPKLLRRAGYETAVIGKWHLRTDPTGFDHWQVLIGQGTYYNPRLKTAAGVERHVGYTTDIVTDETLKWLKQRRDRKKPFMLMCQHKAPHRAWAPSPRHLSMYDDMKIPEPPTLFDDYRGRESPASEQAMTLAGHMSARDLKFVPPPNLTQEQLTAWNAAYGPKNAAMKAKNLQGKDLVRWRYQRYIKDYLRCVASVDENIGRLLAYLDEAGLAENTIVIYSSDQGFYLGDHGWYDKRWMYEESLRMPLVVRWPARIKAGRRSKALVQNLDFAETFLDAAGVPVPDDMQGRSLLPILTGSEPADWRRSVYYHYYEFPGAHSVRRHVGVRTHRHKLMRFYGVGKSELYDLAADPHELQSRYGDPAYADVQQELEAELRRLQVLYEEPDPVAALPLAKPRRRQAALRKAASRVKLRQVLALAGPKSSELPRPNLEAKPLTVGAWCRARGKKGVLLAQGGGGYGVSLYLSGGKLCFGVRDRGRLRVVTSPEAFPQDRDAHAMGILTAGGHLELFVNGERVAHGKGYLLSRTPAEGLSIGADSGSAVGAYASPAALAGELRDLRMYLGVLDPAARATWARRR